ncbi:hypothetical protein [Corynebacterium callunae]|uniref:hypothetical protein n=1 Tax=Corynebacterium callunae TaxID=1721 RepID=UPI0004A458E9|nr:hypothetical protein [Corynebacterium callunae]
MGYKATTSRLGGNLGPVKKFEPNSPKKHKSNSSRMGYFSTVTDVFASLRHGKQMTHVAETAAHVLTNMLHPEISIRLLSASNLTIWAITLVVTLVTADAATPSICTHFTTSPIVPLFATDRAFARRHNFTFQDYQH